MATRPCPHCGEKIQNAAVLCRFCQRQVPKLPEMSGRQVLVSFAVIGAIVAGTAYYETHKSAPDEFPKMIGGAAPAPAPSSDEDIANAKQVIEETIATPASARYPAAEVVAREGAWRMVHVVVDAQNNFGALLRKSMCVTYSTEGTILKWNKAFAVQECGKPPGDDEVKMLKELNGWPGTAAKK